MMTHKGPVLPSLLAISLLVMFGAGRGSAEPQGTAQQEARIAEEMISLIKQISQQRYPDGPVKRFNQVKSLGCFEADFWVEKNLPPTLQHGLFAQPGPHPAHIRFANASEENDSKKDLRGMSIKVLGVEGSPLWGEPGKQDFILNSYPALFVATPQEFLKFIRATHKKRRWWFFFNPLDAHLGSLSILKKARQHHASPFDIRYWSTTPFQLGETDATAVKYSAQPCSSVSSSLPGKRSEHYLSAAMQQHLQQAPACFDFMVQFQSDPKLMPIDDASVIWDEKRSPFLKVATIIINDQPFTDAEHMAWCESLTFHPWQALPQHKPLGAMNRVRNRVYSEISAFRTQQNNE